MKADFSGVWRMNQQKSKLLGPAPTGNIIIEHRDPEFTQTITAPGPGGAPETIVFRGSTAGVDFQNSVRGVAMRSRAQWQANELKIESWLEIGARKAYFCDYWSLAADGNTLVMEHRDDDLAGQRAVLERVG